MKISEVISFIKQNVPFQFYANAFPSEDKGDCGFVRFNGGQAPDKYVLGLKTPSVQIVIRHKDGSEAERIAQDVWDLFNGKEHFNIGSTKVYFTSCDQSEPIYLDKDKHGRTIYSINVTCKVSE